MSIPDTHEHLVARLVADARPIRPLWSPQARLALWMLLPAFGLVVAVQLGLRQDLGLHLRQPLFALEVGALILAGAMAAALALRGAVPGMAPGRGLTMFILLLGAAAVTLVALEPAGTVHSVREFAAGGAQCVASIIAFSALPWIALFVAVRRGAPLDSTLVGVETGAAAFLFGAAAVRIACPIDQGLHLLAWHAGPIAVGMALSAVAGARWLGSWQRA